MTSASLVPNLFWRKTRVSALDALVHIAFVLTGVVTTFLGPLLPLLTVRWRLTDAQSGSFFTAQFVGALLGAGVAGPALHRRGFRFTLVLGYLLMAVGIRGLSSIEWRMALLSTVIYGVGLGLAIPASNLLVSARSQGRRAAAVSVLNLCWGVGAVTAPLIVAAAERGGPLRNSLAALAWVLLFIAAAMTMVPVRAGANPSSRTRTQQRNAVGWKFSVAVAAMFFLYVGIETSLSGWIATLMTRLTAGFTPIWLPAPTVFWSGLLAGRAIAPLALRRVSERWTAVGGLTATVLATGLLMVAPSRLWLLGAALTAGLGLASVFPITVAILSRFGDMEQRVAGMMFALAGLGGATLPWSVGVIATACGSLQLALLLPLLAGLLLLSLHAASGNSGQGAL